MKLSVIIPTHNRSRLLRETLSALETQTLPAGKFEVIVVDDGSSQTHRTVMREFSATYRLSYLEQQQAGLAAARNLGAERASGKILYFLDDDVVPGPNTLSQHLGSHERAAEPVAVVGSLPFAAGLERSAFLWYLERSGHYDLYEIPDKYAEGQPPLPPLNGNSSVGRELFNRVGRYDEQFRHYGGEDLELGYRLAQAGVKFVYNPDAIGYHNHDKDFEQFCVDMERAGASLIQLYGKYPEIKAAKKIDILVDRYADLPGRKKLVKLIMSLALNYPWLLYPPRLLILLGQHFYSLRGLLFPLYRLVAHSHYAAGMRRGLAVDP